MAKKGKIQANLRKIHLVELDKNKREELRKVVKNSELSLEERFDAKLKLSMIRRNSSAVRLRNRCLVTGRPRGYYRKFKISRIVLRQLASQGELPGVMKASW